MIETIRFDRKIAVEQGLRKSVEVDKGYFKRPMFRFLRKKPHPEFSNTLKNIYRSIPSTLTFSGLNVRSYLKEDVVKYKEADKILKENMSISLEDALLKDSFRNKTLYVYVEKQHNEAYALRDLSKQITFIADLNLGGFYDIAGRVVLINLSKAKGVYKVNKIIKVLKD